MSKSQLDYDLDLTMPISNLSELHILQSKFNAPRFSSYRAKTHTDSGEYSKVVFCETQL